MSDTAAASAAAQLGGRAVSNSLFVLTARTVSRVISLVVVIVLANALGDSDYGRYTTKLVLSAASVVVLAIALGLGPGLPSLILPGAALLITTSYATQLRNTFYAVGRAEFDAVALIAEILIQGGLIFLGAKIHAGVSYFVWAYAVSYAFTIVYSLAVIRVFHLGNVRPGLDLGLIRRWWPLALAFAFTSFLTNLYFNADVVILQHVRSFAEVGWYKFAYKPFEATQFVPLAIQTVVYPILGVYFVSSIDRLKVAYARFFKVLVLLGWPLTIGTFVLVHSIGRLFRLFPQSEPALRILAFAIVFLFANSAFYAMLNATNRQHLNAWATGIAAAINIGLNLVFIPLYGYLAASTTTAAPAGFVIYAAALYLLRAIDPEEWRLATAAIRARNPLPAAAVGGSGKA